MRASEPSKPVSVPPEATVETAVSVMNEHRIGSVVVTEDSRVIGIFTERDVLRRVVQEAREPSSTRVRDVMSQSPMTVTPDTTLLESIALMRQHDVRHLPIVEDGTLVGVVSIGDMVWTLARDLHQENDQLHEYIHGTPAAQRSHF
jgi:CBS domain-containing protein